MWHPRWSLMLFLSPILLMPILVWPDGARQEAPIQKPEPSHLPKFKVHDCFHRDGVREPWEGTLPDGIIAMRGYTHYLVMFREEAERRGGQPKWALPLTIELFDSGHHHIACPENWVTHNQRRK
jgi:hypothetical protein